MVFVDGIHKLKNAMRYQNALKLMKWLFVVLTIMLVTGISKLILAIP